MVRTLPYKMSWSELKRVSFAVALRRYLWLSSVMVFAGIIFAAIGHAGPGVVCIGGGLLLPVLSSYARKPGRAMSISLEHTWEWEFGEGEGGQLVANQFVNGQFRGTAPLNEFERACRWNGRWLLYVNRWMYVVIPDRAFSSVADREAVEQLFLAAGLVKGNPN